MKRSIITTLALAAAVGFAFTGVAHAGFTITATRTVGAVDDYINFSALNTGGTTGTKLNGFDATVTTSGTGATGALVFKMTDLDGDGTNDADVTMSTITAASAFTGIAGTFLRAGSVGTFTVASSTPANYLSDPGGTGNPTAAPLPADAYTNLHTFEISGIQTGTPPTANVTAVNFAHIVVPTGTAVTLSGLIGGDAGNSVAFSVSNPVSVVGSISLSATGNAADPVVTVLYSGKPGNYQGLITKINGGTGLATGEVKINDISVAGDLLSPTELLLWINGATPDATASALAGSIGGATALTSTTATGNDLALINFYGGLDPTLGGAGNILLLKFGPGADTTGHYNDFLSFSLPAGVVTAITAVPEPASLGLIAMGALGLLARRRSSKK